MSLQSLINSSVLKAFESMGDLATSGSVRVKAASIYDPVTGGTFAEEEIVLPKLYKGGFTERERSEYQVAMGAVKFIIPGAYLGGRMPKPLDLVECGGRVYAIEKSFKPNQGVVILAATMVAPT